MGKVKVDYEQMLVDQIMKDPGGDVPVPDERQLQVVPGRKFTWDLAWTGCKLLVEVQGSTWAKPKAGMVSGGHTSGVGARRDALKNALATIYGWRVICVTTDMVSHGEALLLLKAFFDPVYREEAAALFPNRNKRSKPVKRFNCLCDPISR
jgi:hypothetical protein